MKQPHFHPNNDSTVSHVGGAAVPIACTCEDWLFKGLSCSGPNQIERADAAMGCKHMWCVREQLQLPDPHN